MSPFDSAAVAWWNWVVPASVQLAVVATVVWALLRLTRRWSSTVRLTLCAVVLLKLIVPLSLSSPTALLGRQDLPAVRHYTNIQELLASRAHIGAASTAAGTSSAAAGQARTLGMREWLFVLHGLGAVVVSVALARQGWALRRLTRQGQPAGSSLDGLLRQIVGEAGMSRVPTLRFSSEVDAPVCFGVLRPTILLPTGLASRLEPKAARAVLAHEVTHLAHRDPLWNALTCVAFVAWWFHPAAWWIARQVRSTQEERCDDALLKRGGIQPEAYGRALLSVAAELARGSQGQRPGALTLSMARREHGLARRLRRILNPQPPRGTHMLHFSAPVLLALTLVPGARPATQEPWHETEVRSASDPTTLDRALNWLVEQQSDDGPQAVADRVGESAPLLALIGAGNTQAVGPQRKLVAQMVERLERHFAKQTKGLPTREDALAALALTEHYLLSGRPAERVPGVKAAIQHITRAAQAPGLDREIAFWSCLALIGAKDSQVEIDAEALTRLRARVPLGATDGALYLSEEATCAASIFLHLVSGGDLDDKRLTGAVERVLGTVARPVTDDPMLTYLGSAALFQIGGAEWISWNQGPLARLNKRADKDGGFSAAKGLPGGRRWATAMASLSLETRYRYSRLSGR